MTEPLTNADMALLERLDGRADWYEIQLRDHPSLDRLVACGFALEGSRRRMLVGGATDRVERVRTGRPTPEGRQNLTAWRRRGAFVTSAMHRSSLTPRQLKAYHGIDAFIAEKGYGPTVDEVAAMVGLKSKQGAHRLLTSLEQRGWIVRRPHLARAITLIPVLGTTQVEGAA